MSRAGGGEGRSAREVRGYVMYASQPRGERNEAPNGEKGGCDESRYT